jgi:hypothetical protein
MRGVEGVTKEEMEGEREGGGKQDKECMGECTLSACVSACMHA